MEIVGYAASLLIGVSLGLIGGGGSILTVPVLVYLLGVDPVAATGYSLFIVGITSLVGVVPKYRQGEVDLKTALIFGVPAIASVFLTRKFLIPLIPQHVVSLGGIDISKPMLLMLIFAILMVFASYNMIVSKNDEPEIANQPQQFNYPMILLEGTVVGILTGLVGAGGGFLIIPALVLFSKLPMKKAVGTSLLIIAAKSLIGFTGDLGHLQVDWKMLMIISLLAIIGIFIGSSLARKISGDVLKKSFGWFVLVMGVYIIAKELWLK